MKYDFNTPDKVKEFLAKADSTVEWRDPLPNLEWISENDFVRSHLFVYGAQKMFTRAFGGPNKDDNLGQFPPTYSGSTQHTTYAKCFLMHDLKGFVLFPEYYHAPGRTGFVSFSESVGKLHFGRFAFCQHKSADYKRLGNCWHHYTCRDCGYKWEVDSSD